MADGHIFLSYSSEDGALAEDLVRQFEASGLKIWYAPRNVRPGTDYSRQLQTAIEQASAFVVIITKSSNESDFVRAETEMAFSRRRPIFPVRYSRIAPAPGLALFLQLRHWTDAFGRSRQTALARLGRELAGISQRGETPPFARPQGAEGERSFSRGMIALAALGCGALLLCILLVVQVDDPSISAAANRDSVGTADNVADESPTPVSTGGQANMEPLVEGWMRYVQETAPPPVFEENFFTDNLTMTTNETGSVGDATVITNAADSVNGM